MKERSLIALLASIAALGPFTVDMYLPAMPGMALEFGVEIPKIQLTLSAYLFGFSIFHLFCGPLADRYGRKPILLAGLALFAFASVGCALASTVTQLIFFRVLQGVGACVGPTLTRTIARDVFGAEGSAQALSYVAMLMALGPAVAPLLGGLMLYFFHWAAIFIFLAVYAVVIWILIFRFLGESLPFSQSLSFAIVARNYASLIRNRTFISYTAVSALMYSGLMIYLASSGFIFVQKMGVRVELFGFVLLTLVFGYSLGSGLSAWLTEKIESKRAVVAGTFMALLATAIMLLNTVIWPFSILGLAIPMGMYTVALGIVLPHSMSIALGPFPEMAGTCSSLMGFIQMGLSAFFAVKVGGLITDSISLMVFGMMIISLFALALAFYADLRLSQR